MQASPLAVASVGSSKSPRPLQNPPLRVPHALDARCRELKKRPLLQFYPRLYYTANGKQSYDYRVALVAVASNMPGVVGGHRYYLVCPTTGKRATVLYLRSGTGVFAHRSAFAGERLYYDSQLENKRFRGMSKYFALDNEWDKQWRKGRKFTYRGQPTRWHARLLKLEQQNEAAGPALLRMLNGF